MKTILYSIVFLFAVTISARSQSMWGINTKIYQTKGDFNKNVDTAPVGLSFNWLYRIKESKFSIGAELGVAMYANNRYKYDLPSGGTVFIDEEDCFWTIHADLRYYIYEVHALKAYAQGRLGMTTFFSSRMTTEFTPEYEDTFEFHGTAFNVGLGGGVLINFKGVFGKEKKQGTVNLDMGVSLHTGSATEYRFMAENSQSTTLNNGTFQSVTNYVDYRVGLIFIPAARKNN